MMETPPNSRIRPQRTPTPKLSERKRALFETHRSTRTIDEDEISPLDGIYPLDDEATKYVIDDCLQNSVRPRIRKFPNEIINLLKSGNTVTSDLVSEGSSYSSNSPKSSIVRSGSSGKSIERRTSPRTPNACHFGALHEKNKYDTLQQTPRSSNRKKYNNKIENIDKENQGSTSEPVCTDELGVLFNDAMNLENGKITTISSDDSCIIENSDEDQLCSLEHVLETSIESIESSKTTKRSNTSENNESPKSKFPKLDTKHHDSDTNNKTVLSILDIHIPTQSFYSNKIVEKRIKSPIIKYIPPERNVRRNRKKSKQNGRKLFINNGVSHNIRPRKNMNNNDKISIDTFLEQLKNKKLKSLPSNRLFRKNLEKVHKIITTSQNPIEMARPLRILANDSGFNFSSTSSEDDDDDEYFEKLETEKPESLEDSGVNLNKRKFFKSGNSSSIKQFKVTDRINATLKNGKLTILSNSKKKKHKSRKSGNFDSFIEEKDQINNIIEKLDASSFDNSLNTNKTIETNIINNENEIISSENLEILPLNENNTNEIITSEIPIAENFINEPENVENDNLIFMPNEIPNNEYLVNYNEINIETETLIERNYDNFWKRLPYNTSDPEMIQQQRLLLEFLITYDICTEDNFKIFIEEPQKYKDEATKILDNLFIIENIESKNDLTEKSNDGIIENSTAPIILEEIDQNSVIINTEEERNNNIELYPDDSCSMDIENHPVESEVTIGNDENLIETNSNNNSNTMKLFPIFDLNQRKYEPIIQKSIRKTFMKNNWLGFGKNQYQIDAGQKKFGAIQCRQCGLVYTVHEPEEEQLHQNYHNSVNILKFKSWIDEDVVEHYPEWGTNGRIIRITNTSHHKRRERVLEVLKFVDQELGYVPGGIPEIFVAFFAIKQNRIAGFCLVQPLENASRYICLNDVDCCTEQLYKAKCGISRIWVSPFHRRIKIASKLINAVQNHTILYDKIDIDEIAFSSPTLDGREFAKKISNRTDFLVYQ